MGRPHESIELWERRLLPLALWGSIVAGIIGGAALVATKFYWDPPQLTWWQIAIGPPVVVAFFNIWLRFGYWRYVRAVRHRRDDVL